MTVDRVPLPDEELTRLCATRLAPYKVPTIFRQVGELPRNATGKIKRRDLAAALRAQPRRRLVGRSLGLTP